ncbi:MAG: glycerophosphodiester phosphodiesterase, partial [Myxococcales bacterium]|nr:glycerophosphodiester phosphodiesterase [Myxococcales bacterium]
MHTRRLYAHRGASAELPENTMPAFERAVTVGVDALEMDVQLTRDDQLIVVHDDRCARTTGAQLAWAALDLADARR